MKERILNQIQEWLVREINHNFLQNIFVYLDPLLVYFRVTDLVVLWMQQLNSLVML